MMRVLIGMMLSFSQPALPDGPFGIAMGTPLAALDVGDDSNRPTLNSVPKPHPDFSTYGAWASPETGICASIALSDRFAADRYGRDARLAFNTLTRALDQKYGPHEVIDAHLGGSLTASEDRVLAIRQEERVLAASWQLTAASGHEIQRLDLQMAAASADEAFLRLFYRGADFDICQTAQNSQSNENL